MFLKHKFMFKTLVTPSYTRLHRVTQGNTNVHEFTRLVFIKKHV